MTAREDRARHLDAFRSAIAPRADRRARNLEDLRRRLEQEGATSCANDRVEPRRSIVPSAIAASVAIAAAALLVLWGGATSVRALREAARRPVHAAPATTDRTPIDRPARPTEGRMTADVTSPAAEPMSAPLPEARTAPPASPAEVTRDRAVIAGTHAPQDAAPSPEDRLRDELALVRAARTALQTDDFAEVWRLTQAHAAEYPQGALTPERDAWRSLAACRLSRSDAGRIFAAFLKDHEGSPYTARVRGACEVP